MDCVMDIQGMGCKPLFFYPSPCVTFIYCMYSILRLLMNGTHRKHEQCDVSWNLLVFILVSML